MKSNFVRQQGMTMWGFATLIVALGFVILMFLKIWPVYYQQIKVSQALHAIKNEANQGMTGVEIRRRLDKKFSIDDVSIIEVREITIRSTPEGRLVTAEKEVVEPLFGNISLLILMNKSVLIP